MLPQHHKFIEVGQHNKPGLLKNLSMASMRMEKHKARRNTPFMRAATISARCHPYEYFGEASLLES
jgi:hypothetical protein